MADDDNELQQQDTTPQDAGVHSDSTPSTDEGGAALDRFMEQTDGPKTPDRQTTESGQRGQARVPERGETQAPQQPRQDTRQSEDVRQVPQAKRQYGQLFYADQRGDIYNAQGGLVAKQGYGRTVFHQMYPYVEALATENASYKTRLENFERANEAAKNSGLTLDDHGAALQLMVSWKKNKLETLKTLLNIAHETGTDISSIQQGGVNPAALRATFEELLEAKLERFNPFVENLQRERESQAENDAVMTQYTAFMDEFPDAGPHQGAIARVMRDHGYTPREAYYAIRAVATQHGLDWNRDLQSQLTPPGSGQDRALPQMSGGRNGASAAVTGSRGDLGGTGEESWDHILRKTFAQHGIQV